MFAKHCSTLLYGISQRLTNQTAHIDLSRLLASTDAKVLLAAAQALRHTESTASLHALTKALRDEDREVRYYAIRGLADVNHQHQWAPSIAEYDEHEAIYRQHWKDWAKQYASTNN